MNSEDLQKAAEFLVEKNDAANEKNRELMAEVDSLRSQLGTALEREQALAAHVEALKVAGENAALEACTASEASIEWSRVCDEAPATSLARRDLIKQAEALEAES